jgi:DNA-binding Lrp family transcriptional regulator
MLDNKDLEILEVLKHHAKWTTHHISKKTLIPVTTVHNRIKKMESMGIIKGYTAILDHKKLGEAVSAFVLVKVSAANPIKKGSEILKELEKFKEVHEAYTMTGNHDIIMRISVKDIEQLNHFIERINDIGGVTRAQTSIILKGDQNHSDKTVIRSKPKPIEPEEQEYE